jgi:hypothetical protein
MGLRGYRRARRATHCTAAEALRPGRCSCRLRGPPAVASHELQRTGGNLFHNTVEGGVCGRSRSPKIRASGRCNTTTSSPPAADMPACNAQN